MHELRLFFEDFTVISYILIFVLCSAVGSFLNVVAYRLPKILFDKEYQMISEFLIEESEKKSRFLSGIKIVDRLLARPDAQRFLQKTPVLPAKSWWYLATPQSSCPNCGHVIRFYENIPVLGWLFLKGKCSGCSQKISAQYPIVELLTGLLSCSVIYTQGFTVSALCFVFFIWILIALTLIDLEFKILPDCLTSPMVWLGLILSYFNVIPVVFKAAFLGAIVGYMSLWLINQFSILVFKKVGIGAGDFKLLALIGAWQGVGSIFNIILISSISGAVIGILMLIVHKNNNKYIPYGPFLALGSVIVLLFDLQPNAFFYLP